jgi:hypothetical protein
MTSANDSRAGNAGQPGTSFHCLGAVYDRRSWALVVRSLTGGSRS